MHLIWQTVFLSKIQLNQEHNFCRGIDGYSMKIFPLLPLIAKLSDDFQIFTLTRIHPQMKESLWNNMTTFVHQCAYFPSCFFCSLLLV